ncbi:MAG: hypothetical protein V7K64_23840 [Nostoc sp.]|nr:hypothetical protein [Nostoc sp. JL34]
MNRFLIKVTLSILCSDRNFISPTSNILSLPSNIYAAIALASE